MKFKAYDIVEVKGRGNAMIMGHKVEDDDCVKVMVIYENPEEKKGWVSVDEVTLKEKYNGKESS